MRHPRYPLLAVVVGLTLVAGGCSGADPEANASETAAAGATRSDAPAEPSPGEKEYAALTASWAPEAVEGCGRGLKETLGTRDLVQGALDGVKDPQGVATGEIEDARHWLTEGNNKLESIRPQLEAGTCSADLQLAFDEAVQFYIKAGTSAVQAGQIAGQ